MRFNGLQTSTALAGSVYAFTLPYNRHNSTELGEYAHNNVPAEGDRQVLEPAANKELSQASKTGKAFAIFVDELDASYTSIVARKCAQVAKRKPLPGTQTPIKDQQYPLFSNGELPRPRNVLPSRRTSCLSPDLHPYMIHSANSVGTSCNDEGDKDMRLPRILSPSPTPEEEDAANILLGMRNPKIVAPTPTREEEATSLSKLGAKDRFNLPRPNPSFGVERLNLPLPSMDNTSIAATTNNSKINNVPNTDPPTPPPSQGSRSPAINNTSNTALPTPPPSQGTASHVPFPNDNVEAEYFRLGLRRGDYPKPVTPPGCAPVEESNVTLPTCTGQKPSWNYLMYTFLSVVPGNRYNTSQMIYAIMEWVPETVKFNVGQYNSKRHAQCANSRNPEVFVKVDGVDCRLRREGEPVRKIEKRKRNDNDDDKGPDEPQPQKKKRTTKKPAIQKPKKGGKGEARATKPLSSKSVYDIVTENPEDD